MSLFFIDHVCVCLQRVGFLPLSGEAVTWQTLQQPVMTFDFHWTVLDVTPPPEENNSHYCEHETHTHMHRVGQNDHDQSLLQYKTHCDAQFYYFLSFSLISYVSLSSDGLDFGAVLVKPSCPLHEDKIPLVVFIHGMCLLHL